MQEDPDLRLYGEGHDIRFANLTHFVMDTAQVTINPESTDLSHDDFLKALLASLGVPAKQSHKLLWMSVGGLKNGLDRIYDKVGASNQQGIARYMFESEAFTISKNAAAPLPISPKVEKTLTVVSFGKTSEEATDTLGIPSSRTIDSQLQRASDKTGWRGREKLILAAFVHGNIGDFAMRNTSISPETDES